MALINGTPSADVIMGTAGDDIIHAFGGNDTVDGGGGNDKVYGGGGDDWLSLGTDGDIGNGQAGNDTFFIDAGRAVGGADDDHFFLASNTSDTASNVMGHEVVRDFHAGEDDTDIILNQAGRRPHVYKVIDGQKVFDLLDSNGDHRIDAGDHGVTVGEGGLGIDFRETDAAHLKGVTFEGEATALYQGVDALTEADWSIA